MLPPLDVTPLLSNALRYSSATDLRCSSVIVCRVIAMCPLERGTAYSGRMPLSMEQEPYRVEAKVELTKPPEPDAGIDWPAWIQAISPILLALVGLYFTDTVREGFERQQLQLANASGMQGLLVQLLGANVSQIDAHAAASTLASFGPPAVAPLITALADADDVRTPAIEGRASGHRLEQRRSRSARH